jgi:hypothetical protein
MNPEENNDNKTNNNDEITIKIRTMDKEFEIKIKKTSTIKELKEKIEEVNNKLLIL